MQTINPQLKEKPWRSKKYRDFVKDHPCCVDGCYNTDIWAHHVQEQYSGNMSGKPSDTFCVPLCTHHHTGNQGIHVLNRVGFHKAFEVDFYRVMFRLLKEWVER